ncbi:hypothetical protein MAR_015892, partial [Mya arenaria]
HALHDTDILSSEDFQRYIQYTACLQFKKMASSKSLMLVLVLVALTLTSAVRRRRACRLDGATGNCVEVVGWRGALKGVALCQIQGGKCMHFERRGPIKCACIEVTPDTVRLY